MEEKNLDKHFLFDNNEIQNLESKLVELRLNGQTKISQLKDEIDIVKTNKFSDKNQKREEISSLKAQLAEARNDKKAHSEEIKTTVKIAIIIIAKTVAIVMASPHLIEDSSSLVSGILRSI